MEETPIENIAVPPVEAQGETEASAAPNDTNAAQAENMAVPPVEAQVDAETSFARKGANTMQEENMTVPPVEVKDETEASTGPKGANIMRFVLDILETLLLSAALFLAINAISARVRVDGISMTPTLHNGELVLVNRLAYKFNDYRRGDIIVFHFTTDPPQDLIKRIIGLPGDQIYVQGGLVKVNNEVLNEPYIAAAPLYDGTWDVPDGYLFVLGDNRNDSADSHSWGMLDMQKVLGKAVLVYWPLENWSLIDHYDYESGQFTK